jgi:hypothetical protein
MDEATPPTDEPRHGIIGRPPEQLHDYPVQVRWEVTRRHPYYLLFWEEALRYRREAPGDRSDRTILGHAAVLMLGSIGVTGEPVGPETGFEELIEGHPDPTFLTGSVQPITFRAVVAMLINGLPPAERREVGLLLLSADADEFAVPGDNDNRDLQKRFALGDLTRLASPALDSCPEIPLFYIHLGASQRSIARDVEDQARRWKARRGLGSRKVHTANLDEYLKVWDLREGWTGGGYDRSRELIFAEVGRRLKLGSISTVANHFRSAFEMITGHPFTPELWWRLFGPLKCSELLGGPAAKLAAPVRHHHRSRTPRPVPESTISPQTDRAHGVGMVENGSAIYDDMEQVDLLMDMRDLIDRGLTDEEIARRLELEAPGVVAYFRSRADDFRSI